MSVSDKLPSNRLGKLHMKICGARGMNIHFGGDLWIRRTTDMPPPLPNTRVRRARAGVCVLPQV